MKKFEAEHFQVKKSKIRGAGKGLFALHNIKKGDTIGYFTGNIITDMDELPDSDYLFEVCNSYYIDGVGPEANYTRFMNHSAGPNVEAISSNRWKSIRFQACRSIRAGEEMFIDYGPDYWDSRTPTDVPEMSRAS